MQSLCGFQNINFPYQKRQIILKETKIFFFYFRARQGLTLVLRILIKNEKSGLRSSLRKTFWKTIWKRRFNFFGGEPDKDWPCSYVSHNGESSIT